jgi:hypothetical protein
MQLARLSILLSVPRCGIFTKRMVPAMQARYTTMAEPFVQRWTPHMTGSRTLLGVISKTFYSPVAALKRTIWQ